MSRRLFLDLDGVMADFDTHFETLFNALPPSKGAQGVNDDVMWELIHAKGDFFETMPLMDGAKRFYMTLSMHGIHPIILTAASKRHYPEMAGQKMRWVRKHFNNDILCLPVYGSSSKQLFVQNPGDVLIDDYKKNIDRWNAAGGEGILHTGSGDQNFDITLTKFFRTWYS